MRKIRELISEIEKAIVGKETVIETVLMAILAQGHVLLEDIPGVGKTTLALAVSRALGLEYRRIQFTPDVLPSDVVGYSIYEKEQGKFIYQPGAVMCNLLLADEINRTSSKTQAALLEVMEEGHVTVDGKTHQVPKPFAVIATQNPFGSAGTQLLPQSQLDRFTVKLQMGYPDFQSQVNILKDRQQGQPLEDIRQVVSIKELTQMQEEVRRIHVEELIMEYITHLAEATREHEYIQLGVSPRGAYAVNNMAKASAYMKGRDYVIPEDVMEIFSDVCAHRVILHPKTKVTGVTSASIMEEIMKKVPIPGMDGKEWR